VYLLLTLFLEHHKRTGKYCAIASTNKFAFDSSATKELVKMFEDKTFSCPLREARTALLCLTVCKKQNISRFPPYTPQITPTDPRR